MSRSERLLSDLRAALPGGEVYGDSLKRGLYATDASIYQQVPVAVCVPRTREEVATILRVARDHEAPLLGRGGGTSLAGQTVLEAGVVVDFSKHLNKLLEVDAERRLARVEPGAIRDRLNAALKPRGLMFAPETSTSNRAAVGGMIGNNSSGMMSVRFGRTSEHVEALQALLADGTEARFGPAGEASLSDREAALKASLRELAAKNRALIEERWPKVMRRVGGYSLDELLKPEPNWGQFLCGSEGTLALTLEATVRLSPLPGAVAIAAVHYRDFNEALRAVLAMVAHQPLSVELIDRALVDMARSNPASAHLCGFVEGNPESILFVEADAATEKEARAKLEAILDETRGAYAIHRGANDAERQRMHQVRKLGLGLLQRIPGEAKPISFIEDSAVPVEKMPDFIGGLQKICDDEGLKTVVYGHASVGVLHFKPILNLKSAEDLEKMDRVSSRAAALVKKMGGSWSGEHGDGIIRGAKNPEFWGPEIYGLFQSVKRLFDPTNLLNPGKIVDTPGIREFQRYGPEYAATWESRHYKFRKEGGFQAAVEMCNGTGACRKVGSGTMCPSYMATLDEEHCTRGRANALRLAMSGQLGPEAFASDELHDALDLCLECKACASECPSNVDMAKMKSEFLAERHRLKGATLRDRVFAFAPDTAKLIAGPLARIANPTMNWGPIRRFVAAILGVAPERKLPTYATRTFESWFRARRPANPEGREVAIFLDTYTNYYEPRVGQAMTRALERLGCRVVLAKAGCCCRPMISKGFLGEAATRGERTLRALLPFAEKGTPVVVLEPSCLSSLRDDLPDLIDDGALGKKVGACLTSPDALVERLLSDGASYEFGEHPPRFLLHGHCHQKALDGTDGVKKTLRAGGAVVDEVDSGCCGMAGSFGYEAEHYELSQKIGESRLFPAARSAGRTKHLIANGFSCRHQIAEATGRQPLHYAEALELGLRGGDGIRE